MIPLLAALGILVVLSAAGLLRRAWRRRRLRTLEIDVTRAIGRAERAETRDDARDAWGEVATLEAELAQAYPAATLDGGVAREGAVAASRKAGDATRAAELADRYRAEPGLTPARRDALDAALRPLSAHRRAIRRQFEEP